MNHVYRLKRSGRTQQLQPVPETARAAGKGTRTGKTLAQAVTATLASFALGGIASLAYAQQAPPASAPTAAQLPQGGVVTRGSANIVTNTGQAQLTVNQSSNRAVIDWASFNVGSQAKVQFNQPSSSAVTLNNILGNNASQIYGQISANGQVFLSNPNGVYFSPTAQVNVGGLVATTGKANADEFMAGKGSFNRDGSTGSVVNQGQLTSAAGGYIALLAPEVRNQGVVVAQAGTVALASGEVITLNFNNTGTGLAGITTTPQAIAALVENRSAVLAEGGQIILSAHALASLQGSVVNNSGQLSATSLSTKGGKIVLMADKIELTGTSKIDANGPQGGGTVLVGGDWQGSGDTRQATKVTMAPGASIEANATGQGNGGKVVLWSDVKNANSLTQVEGRIEAKGAGTGNGGQVETSGHTLKVGDTTRVNTLSTQGAAGQWLLDPNDFTVAAVGGDIDGATLSGNLGLGNVTITSASGGTASTTAGSIFVNDTVSWNANTLTLNAENNVTVNQVMTLTSTAGLAVQFGQQSAPAVNNNALFTANAPINIATTGSFATKLGSATGSVSTSYTIINSLGGAADATTAPANPSLQGMASAPVNTAFVLGSDIDASATTSWNSGAGFKPIGNGTTSFTGKFNGLGHTITGLTQDGATSDYLGLFGKTTGSISNVTLSSSAIAGRSYVGSLAGFGADFYNVRILGGSVTGTTYVGGMAGYASAAINTVNGNAAVTGRDSATVAAQFVGGLLGKGVGAINNVTGSGTVVVTNTNTALVTGASAALSIHSIGGLVGQLAPTAGMTLSNNINTGNVTVTTATASCSVAAYCISNVGGLIGTLGGGVNNSAANWRVSLTDSINSGAISVTSTTTASMGLATTNIGYATGGMIGRIDYAGGTNLAFGGGLTLTNLASSGAVNGYSAVGGLVGRSNLGSNTAGSNVFTTLAATGNVTGFGGTGAYGLPSSTVPSNIAQGVGGLLGVNQGNYVGQINDSHYSGTVLSRGGLFIGGLAGTHTGLISNSYATGAINMASTPLAVSETSAGIIGGLVGYLGGGTTAAGIINGSYSNVAITLGSSGARTVASRVGGLVGTTVAPISGNRSIVISDSSVQGDITAYLTMSGSRSPEYIGGLVGYGSVPDYSTSTVSVSGNTLTVSSVTTLGAYGATSSVGDYLAVGSVVSGPGILPGTYISALVSGTGGAGTYQLNQAQTTAAGITVTTSTPNYINNSVVTGNVTAAVANQVGGLAGQAGSIFNSHTLGNVSGKSTVGGLAGFAHSVYNSYALGNVSSSANGEAGGLLGRLTSNLWLGIASSYWSGQEVSGSNFSGGLVGYSFGGAVYNSYAIGSGAVRGGTYSGGLVGATTGDIVNSYSTVTVIGAGNSVGGLVGSFGSLNSIPTMTNSWATGSVTSSTSGVGIGGLVGSSYGTVINSYAGGAVTGTNGATGGIGGLLGSNMGGGSVNNSFANGTVTSTSTSTSVVAYAGGLIGFNQSSGSVNNSYASGAVTVNGLASAGGLIGYTAIPVVATSQEITTGGVTNTQNFSTTYYTAIGVTGVGATITGTGIPAGTFITAMASAAGSLTLSQNVTVAGNASVTVTNITQSSSASIAGTTLTLGGAVTGYFAPGTAITGAGIPAGTYITAVQTPSSLLANGFGGAGSTYTLNNSVNLSNIGITGTNVAVSTYSKVPVDGFLVASSVAGGLSVGMTVTGPGIPVNTTITGVTTKMVSSTATLGYTLSNNFGTIASPIAVVGQLANPNISNVYATGSVRSNTAVSTAYSYLGGLIGQVGSAINSSIANGYASGAVIELAGRSTVIKGGVIGYIGSGNTSGTSLGSALAPTLSTVYFNNSANSGFVGVGNDVLTPAGNLSTGTSGLSASDLRTSTAITGFNFTDSILGVAANGRAAAGNYWVLVDADGSYNNALGATGASYPMLASEYNLKVSSGHQLQLMGLKPSVSYALQNSISFGSTDVWDSAGFIPVGTTNSPFTGSFTGSALFSGSQTICPAASGGCTISDLTINSTQARPVGLFGTVGSGATLAGIRLLNANVTGVESVGAVVGSNAGTLSFSSSTGTVSSTNSTNTGYGVGGIVGENTGAVDRVFSMATVTGTLGANMLAGGVIGFNQTGGTLSNAYAASLGSISSGGFAGGLAGGNMGTISNSYAAGPVTGASTVSGGLVGTNASGTLSNSFWDTSTTGQSSPIAAPGGGGGGGGLVPGGGGGGGGVIGTLNNNAGMDTVNMQTLANYNSATADNAGVDPAWNLSTIWNPPVAGALYPALRDFLIPITVTAKAVSKVYDGAPYSDTVSLSYSLPNISLSGTATYESSIAGYLNVGNYNITPTGLYSNQYNVTYASGPLTITKRPLSFTISTLVPKLYDGTNLLDPSNITINNLVAPQTLSVISVKAVSSQVSANASNYISSITLGNATDGSGGLLANYSVPTTLTRVNAAVTIVAQGLTVSGVTASDKAYDGTTTATVSGGVLTGVLAADNGLVSVSGTGTFANANVANGISVSAALTGVAGGNYVLTQPVGLSANITAKTVTLTNTARSTTYDGTSTYGALASGTAFTAGGLVGSDSVASVTQTPSGTGVTNSGIAQAGNFSVTPSTAVMGVGNANNYNFSYFASTHTVDPAVVSVTPITGALQGTVSKVYDGTNVATLNAGNYLLTGWATLAEGATVTKTTGTYDSADAGSGKTVTVSLVDADYTATGGTNLANYTLPTSISGAVGSISKAALTATGNSASVTYNGANQSVSGFTVSGLQGSDTVGSLSSVVASGATGKNAGSYTNTVTAGTETNYTVSTVNGSLAIAKAALTATGNSASVTYNGANQSVSGFTVSGLQGSDTVSSLSTVAASGATGKNAGSYANTVTAGTETNYTVTTANGSLAIAKANATVTANSGTSTYTGKDQTVSGFTVSGLVGGESPSVLTGVSASRTEKNAGTYAITPSGTDGNYQLTFVDGSLVINPATLAVRVNDDAKFVTQADAAGYAGVSYSGFVGGESDSVVGGTLTIGRSGSGPDGNTSASSNTVGSYTGALTASGLTSPNYTLNYQSGNYRVIPADQLLIKLSNASTTYGSAASYSVTEAKYLNQSNTIVDLTGSVTRSESNGTTSFAVSDGVGGSARFAVASNGALLSGAGQLSVGTYQLGATGVSVTSNNFSSNLALVGALEVHTAPLTPALAPTKVYDSTPVIAGLNLGVAGAQTGDLVSATGTGSFANKNAGTGMGYTVANLALTGTDARNYYLTGTDAGSTVTGANGTITPAPLTVNFTATDKVYDGNTRAVVTPTDNRFAGDVLSVSATGNFADKNVGTAKPVNVTAVALSGADATNYTVSPTASSTATITRLAQVTWVGGPTGSWFDPANWAGGAVPDLANVANVTIPAGVTVSFDNTPVLPAQAEPVSIDSLGVAGSLSQSAGTLNVGAGGVTLNTLTQTGGELATTGALTLGSLSQSGGSLSAGSLSTTTSYSQTGNGTINVTGDVSITATTAPVLLGNLNTGGTLNVNSTGGSITQTAGTVLTVTGPATLTASQNGAPANVDLGNAGNTLSGPVTVSGADVTLTTTGPLTASVTATGDATLTSGGTTTLGASTVGGDLSVTSTGDVTQTAPLSVAGTTTVSSTQGDVVLSNPNNNLTGVVTAQGTNVTVKTHAPQTTVVTTTEDATLSTAGTLTVSGTAGSLTTQSGGTTTLGTTTVKGDVQITTNNGDIAQTGTLLVGGAADLNAGTGKVTLTDPGNGIAGPVTVVGTGKVSSTEGMRDDPSVLKRPVVLTPAMKPSQSAYLVTVLKLPQNNEAGVVHIELRDGLEAAEVELPAKVQGWIDAAGAELSLVGAVGVVELTPNRRAVRLLPAAERQFPLQFAMQAGQQRLSFRIVKRP
ncbi:YDG domain-containing protein [Limnohabitans sp.]|uniref:YDG domain-containing protein n=1 Tax=Limnohabitans sp. TaxID=1907725 RepID=UPI002AFEB283|nr:YDG domain-containing protein [Limnohabitans sp.]